MEKFVHVLTVYMIQAVGFDCEWVFVGHRLPVALIQIATHDGYCVLVRVFQLKSIPVTLRQFLSDKRYVDSTDFFNYLKTLIDHLSKLDYAFEILLGTCASSNFPLGNMF
jgi:hypothetical protein